MNIFLEILGEDGELEIEPEDEMDEIDFGEDEE
jgi:hypothetical protein